MRITTTEEALRMKAALFVDPEVPRVGPEEPWASLVEKAKSHPEHTVLVVDENNVLLGIVTDYDLLSAMTDASKMARIQDGTLTAAEVMTRVDPNGDTVARSWEEIGQVIERLRGANAHRRPFKAMPLVNDSGAVLGQVTRSSIQRALDELLRP
ncbi:MAG: CBS domain-containing protein [Chloroflexia bacterium]